MNTPRIFTIKIETTLLAYCEEDLLYEFIEFIRSDSIVPEFSFPVIDKSLISINEDISNIDGTDTEFFMEDHPFNNGDVCKLKKDVIASGPFYSIKLASKKEAAADAKRFKFSNSFSDRGGEQYSEKWVQEVARNRDNLMRFGKALKNHSKFPEVKEFETDSVHEKCAIVSYAYESWLKLADGESIDEERENRMNYYLLRYPDLVKIFNNMKKNGVRHI